MIAVLAPEPIRPRMAGMGIRALELARALAREFETRLLVPNDPAEAREAAGDVEVARRRTRAGSQAARGAKAAVVSGHAANDWFHQVPDVPVAVDLYDPFPIENLHYARTLGRGHGASRPRPRSSSRSAARGLLSLRFLRAAALLRRRALRPRPDRPVELSRGPGSPRPARDRPLRRSRSRRPSGDRAAGRRAAGVPEEGPLVLFGGIYDWYDPGLLLDAWPEVRETRSRRAAPLLREPEPGDDAAARLRGRARPAKSIDPEGRSIVFSPWLPYASRADLYAAADLARFDLLGRPGDGARVPHAAARRGLGRRALRGRRGRHARA